jgi:thioredoxin-like negative regulator of GroEL
VLQHRGNHSTFAITRVDASARPDLAERFRVEALPTIVVVDGNRVRARLAAPRSSADIRRALGPWLH